MGCLTGYASDSRSPNLNNWLLIQRHTYLCLPKLTKHRQMIALMGTRYRTTLCSLNSMMGPRLILVVQLFIPNNEAFRQTDPNVMNVVRGNPQACVQVNAFS